ncbi:MAG TPA: hypothetical protein VI895_04070 [Bdellovibrionota bacterium]|nr:hypothetical protein [Bdellovibrionota bacterium]
MGYFVPGLWVSLIWGVPDRAKDQGAWEYLDSISRLQNVPIWIQNQSELSNGRVLLRQLSDSEVVAWDENLAGKSFTRAFKVTKNVAIPTDPFPPIAFGIDAPFNLNKDLPSALAKYFSSPNIAKATLCRTMAITNQLPIENRDPKNSSYIPVEVRTVCPSSVKGRWSLFLKLLSLDEQSGYISGGAGLYSERCLPTDPMILLNRPPFWASSCTKLGCLNILRGILEKSELPSWPIYVEQKGRIRRAEKADLPWLSKGEFRIPN